VRDRWGRRGRSWALAGIALGAALAPAGAQAAATSVTAKPALFPAFARNVPDYVSRCSPGVPLHLSVKPRGGESAAVNGGRQRRRAFTAAARLRDGQAMVLKVRSRRAARSYRVRCLSPKFPAWTAARSGQTQAEWYILTPSQGSIPGGGLSRYVAIFDRNGVPVWWIRRKIRPIDASLLANGHLVWGRFFGEALGIDQAGAYEEHRLDGSLVRTDAAVGSPTDIHDMQRLPNGDSLLISYVPRDGVDLSAYGGPARALVLDGEIQEITPRGGEVWSWNTKDHIALAETGRWWQRVLATPVHLRDGRMAYDVVHLNSIDPAGSGIVVSARHTDAVYDIDRATGAVRWKLGGTARPESLTVLGDPQFGSAPFGGQHDARVLPDGTLTVHDNGTMRGRPPRALRLSIDTAAKTATLAEEISDPALPLSAFAGSVRRLSGGNWVLSWGGNPLIEERTSSGATVFRLTLPPGWFSYRAFPVPYGRLSRAALARGMDAMHPR
jgi:hypothetical protein